MSSTTSTEGSTFNIFSLFELQCPNGYTKSLLSCYKNCPAGYYNWYDKCFATCDVKDGKSNPGWISFSGECWPRIYDRGMGTLPDGCASPKEYFQGLCWSPCNTAGGYYRTTWSPETCSQKCPANTVEGGFANCTKINEYGRGWGNKGKGCKSGFTDVGLFCYQWPFGFEGYDCPSNCDANFVPINPRIHYYKGCNTTSDPNLLPAGVPCQTLPSSDIIDPNTGNPTTDPYFNTKQRNRNNEQCEEHASGGSLCYPTCDVGYVPFGTNICTPSCGPLRDDGATCHRDWYDRGAGEVPGQCSDPNRAFEKGLCYIPCNPDYHPSTTMCIKSDCPDNNTVTEQYKECIPKSFDNSSGWKPAIPPISDTINATWDLAHMGQNFRTIVLNGGLILGCVVIVVLIFGYNATLRSKPIQA